MQSFRSPSSSPASHLKVDYPLRLTPAHIINLPQTHSLQQQVRTACPHSIHSFDRLQARLNHPARGVPYLIRVGSGGHAGLFVGLVLRAVDFDGYGVGEAFGEVGGELYGGHGGHFGEGLVGFFLRGAVPEFDGYGVGEGD